jgi:hypothetical protein
LILDDQELTARFKLGESVVRTLRALAGGVGATAIADYTWEPASDAGTVRELRRATPVGLVGLAETEFRGWLPIAASPGRVVGGDARHRPRVARDGVRRLLGDAPE